MTADRTLEMAGRYEARLSREYERAIRNPDRVRAERKQREVPEETAAEKEIRQNEPESVKLQNEPKPPVPTGLEEAKNKTNPGLSSQTGRPRNRR